jgi:hypothetical protein
MQQRRVKRQKELFEPTPAVVTLQLPKEIQEQLRQSLVQWMQSLGKGLGKEASDEQDHG